jgi:hypothetical protein
MMIDLQVVSFYKPNKKNEVRLSWTNATQITAVPLLDHDKSKDRNHAQVKAKHQTASQ